MLPSDVVEWLQESQHPGYARYLQEQQAAIRGSLEGLGISPCSEIGQFYLDFGPAAALGWYELNELDDVEEWTSYANRELGVPDSFIALTSIEGQGITLYEKSTGHVFDVEFGQFDALVAGKLKPIASSFAEFLRWCRARTEELP